jgi:hypothetical protein
MVFIEKTGASPGGMTGLAKRHTGKAVNLPTDNVPQRMTGDRVKREQYYVDKQDERATTYAKAAIEPERTDGVVPENNQEDERYVKEITMEVL